MKMGSKGANHHPTAAPSETWPIKTTWDGGANAQLCDTDASLGHHSILVAAGQEAAEHHCDAITQLWGISSGED